MAKKNEIKNKPKEPASTLQVGHPVRFFHNGTQQGWAAALPALVAELYEDESAMLVVFNRALPSEQFATIGANDNGQPYYIPVEPYISANEMKAINMMLEKIETTADNAVKESESKGDKKGDGKEGQNGAGEGSEAQ